jgi:hypothetical protein
VKDEILINSQPFGTFKNINEAFIIESVDQQAQTVTLYSPKRKKSYTFTNDIIQTNFMKPVDETKPIEQIVVTPQIKENLKSTEDNIATLGKSNDRLDEIESESNDLTPDERLNNIINIFNQC